MASGGCDGPGDVLAQPTRARPFAHLARFGSPAGTNELAAEVGLDPSGVRVHLERLHSAGLIARERVPQPVGRPRDSWSVAPDALLVGQHPGAYRHLARWLAHSIPKRPGRLREVERAGRELGRELPSTGGRAGNRISFRDARIQPRTVITSPEWSGIEAHGRRYSPFTINVKLEKPWHTLSGRMHFHVDHAWMLEIGEGLPVFRPPLHHRAIFGDHGAQDGSGRPELTLKYLTPHSKWSITPSTRTTCTC